nr:unnamed protein product [Spirometra erinaceieuropaei]
MAQRIFQSFRRLPGQFSAMRRKQDSIEVVGNHYKINMFSNVGFPAKPASLAYDYALNIFALVTKDGLIYVYGKPGIVYVGSHQNASEIINVMFLNGTGKLLTLSDRDDIYIWQLESVDGAQPCVKQICNLSAVTQCLEQRRVDVDQNSTENTFADVACHVTALYANTNGTSIYFGTENGHVALIHKNTQNKRGTLPHGNEVWTLPTYDESISPQRVLQTIPSEKRSRLRLDAVVVLSERPGFVGQLLIGYNSGVSLIYDLHADCVLALLPWQYGLEAATWCGGSGLPIRNASSRPMTQSPQLGTRLLTAHADGSLGVWRVPVFSRIMGDQPAQILSMEEAPSMPYAGRLQTLKLSLANEHVNFTDRRPPVQSCSRSQSSTRPPGSSVGRLDAAASQQGGRGKVENRGKFRI